MGKAYAVVEVEFDYNDQIFYEGGYSMHEVKAYRSKEKADFIALNKNVERLRGLDLKSYCYSLDDLILPEDMDRFFELIKKDKKSWGDSLPEDLPDEVGKELLEILHLKFYEVQEIEVED